MSTEPIFSKIHIRGLDEFTSSDILSYLAEYFSSAAATLEWIDDTSANLVFETSEPAAEAFKSLSLSPVEDTTIPDLLQLRPARPSSSKPSATLQIRIAVAADRKRAKAHEASRFYMMHPEHDPRENRRRGRRDDSHGYRRNRFGDDEHQRRRKGDERNGYKASMYDDEPGNPARRGSRSSFSSEDREDRHRLSRSQRRSRNRSASPIRKSNGRIRDRTSPPPYSKRDPNPAPRQNLGKELFPVKSRDIGNDIRGTSSNNQKELFPNKSAAANLKRELFPLKSGGNVTHRRTDAVDATEETTNLLATGMTVPFVDGPNDTADAFPLHSDSIDQGGFKIRGTSKSTDLGFAIRGSAITSPPSKELFPAKVNNAGKELFSRGVRRNKAADMFG